MKKCTICYIEVLKLEWNHAVYHVAERLTVSIQGKASFLIQKPPKLIIEDIITVKFGKLTYEMVQRRANH